ncbi:MAG: hypothetical protein QM778_11950 [Myxococcales bacterium]
MARHAFVLLVLVVVALQGCARAKTAATLIDQVIVGRAELAAMAGWLERYMRAV